MNPKQLDELWQQYRKYCETKILGTGWEEKYLSVPSFLTWLSFQIKPTKNEK